MVIIGTYNIMIFTIYLFVLNNINKRAYIYNEQKNFSIS